MAVPYGIPQAMLPVFERDRESEFALLKMALDNLVGSNGYLSEQYKYQLLLSRLKLPGALHLAKAYMYDDRPYTSALHACKTSTDKHDSSSSQSEVPSSTRLPSSLVILKPSIPLPCPSSLWSACSERSKDRMGTN